MNELLRRLLFLPPEASSVARSIDHLHFVVISATMGGSALVFLVASWFVIRYRRRPGDVATPRVRIPRSLELALITGTLGMFLLFWVVGFAQYTNLERPPPNAIDVYVTARQWMWKFAYRGGRSSVGVLAVPVGRPVRLIMTSRDVIHSFYVPAFRIKQDVVPGRYQTTWFTATRAGTYDLECAEYCGLSHSRMLGEVIAMEPVAYAQWLERVANRDDLDVGGVASDAANGEGDLAAIGRRVATRHECLACHTIDGQAHLGPTWRQLFRARVELADGTSTVADEAYLTRSMMDPQAQLVRGFAPIMPTYRGVLDAPETAALIEYIKSLDGPAAPLETLPRLSATVQAPDARAVTDVDASLPTDGR